MLHDTPAEEYTVFADDTIIFFTDVLHDSCVGFMVAQVRAERCAALVQFKWTASKQR